MEKFNLIEFKKDFYKSRDKQKFILAHIYTFIEDPIVIKKIDNLFFKEFKSFNSLYVSCFYGAYASYSEYSNLKFGLFNKQLFFIDKNLYFYSYLLQFERQKESISNFLYLKREFERNILFGDFLKAEDILNTVKDQYGQSFWLIESTFKLKNLSTNDDNSVWQYRSTLLTELKENNNHVLAIICDIISYKAEKDYSLIKYKTIIKDYFSELEKINSISQEFATFLMYYVDYTNFVEVEDIPSVLLFSHNSSLVDKYLLFQNISKLFISDNQSFFIEKVAFGKLIIDLNDCELFSIVGILLGESFLQDNSFAELDNIVEKYYIGEYFEVVKKTEEIFINKREISADLINYYIKSCIKENMSPNIDFLNSNSLLSKILKIQYVIYSKNSDSDEDYLWLLKMYNLLGFNTIGICLFKCFHDNLDWQTEIDFNKFYLTFAKSIKNPKLKLKFINSEDIEAINLLKNDIYYELKYTNNISQLQLDVLLKDLEYSNYDKSRVLCLLYNHSYNIEDYNTALKIYVKYSIENIELFRKIDTSTLKYKIIESKFKILDIDNLLIELPIYCFISGMENNKIKQALEFYLKKSNCNYPRQFIEILQNLNIDSNLILVFLEYTCTVDILKYSIHYKKIVDVINERIIVLQYLLSQDISKEKALIFSNEIVSLTKKIQIQNTISELERGKIYINTDKIYRLTTGELSPLTKKINSNSPEKIELKKEFNRLVSIKKFKISNIFYNIVINSNNDVVFVYNDDFSLKIIDLFKQLRDIYVYNDEYGLNSYLSTRIRHGTLPNHLRNIFERNELVTSVSQGKYLDNNIVNSLNFEEYKKEKLQTILKEFSKEIDDFIYSIKNDSIQCLTENNSEHPYGLFNFKFEDSEILGLIDKINLETYEQFFEDIIEYLDNKLDLNLENIKDFFLDFVLNTFLSKLQKLREEILEVCSEYTTNQIITAISKATTDIQAELKTVSKWFTRSEQNKEEIFALNLLIDTSIQIVKNIYSLRSIEFNVKNTTNIITQGFAYNHIIDLFIICLDNIIKHSHLEYFELKPNIYVSIKENKLTIGFKNYFKSDLKDEINEKMDLIKKNWHILDNNISQEDGSGFSKIKKILYSDLDLESCSFNYTIEKQNRLNISFSFELNKIIYESIDN